MATPELDNVGGLAMLSADAERDMYGEMILAVGRYELSPSYYIALTFAWCAADAECSYC
jgi:hypothetical protein